MENNILFEIATKVKDLMGAETSAVVLTEEGGEMIHYAASVGKLGEALTGRRGPAAVSGLCGTTLAAGTSVLVSQALGDNRVRQDHVKAFGIETAVSAPMYADGEAIGVLMAMNREDGNAFSAEQESLLVKYAEEATSLIKEYVDATGVK